MAWSEWVTAGHDWCNDFGSSSQFWLLTQYRYQRSGNTVNYEVKLTGEYRTTGSGAGQGTYDDAIGVNLYWNGSWVEFRQIASAGTFYSSGNWDYRAIGSSTYSVSITNTTGSGNVGFTVRMNNYPGCTRFDSPDHGYSATIPQMDTYTVSYNANGGNNAPADQTKQHDVTLILTSDRPTRASSTSSTITINFNGSGGSPFVSSATSAVTTNYTFSKWNTAANGSGTDYNSGANYTANASATLYAQWTSTVAGYAPITLPNGFKAGGYVLAGYSKTQGATTIDSGMTVGASWTPDQARTLYAVWTKQSTTLKICQEIYDLMWPIGSIYMTAISGVDPSSLFGGTWEAYSPNPYEGVYMWKRTA